MPVNIHDLHELWVAVLMAGRLAGHLFHTVFH